MRIITKYRKVVPIVFLLFSIFIIGILILAQNKRNIINTQAANNTPARCNCTDSNNCYPDGCSGKPKTSSNTLDDGRYDQVCRNIDFGWPPDIEVQKYFCSIRQPDSCFDVSLYKDDRYACFMERWFCHPSLCEGAGGNGDCGKYWHLPEGWTAYGCVKGPDNDHLTPVWGNLPPNLPIGQQSTPTPQSASTPTITPTPTMSVVTPTVTITPVPIATTTSAPTPTITPTPLITVFVTPAPQQTTFIPKGIVFIFNKQRLPLDDIQLSLISMHNNSIVQVVHYTNNLHGTPIHFKFSPVSQGEYSLVVTAKSHDGVVYRQTGKCEHYSKTSTCIMVDGNPVIVEIKLSQFIQVEQVEKNLVQTLDEQKKAVVAIKKLDADIDQKINAWFLKVLQRILKP